MNNQQVACGGQLCTFCIMDQQVGPISCTVVGPHPKPRDLTIDRLKGVSPEDLIYARRKALERLMVRGERLIKRGDGWFSTKAIEVA